MRALPAVLYSILVFIPLLFPWRTNAQSVILHLTNGDRLSGSLVSEESGQVVLSNAILGRMTVTLSSISRREIPTNAAVTAATPKPPPTPPPTPALSPAQQKKLNDLQAIYASGNLSAEEFQRQRTALVTPPKPPGPKYWSAELFAGLDLLFGEKDRQMYTGRAKLTYVRPSLRNHLDYIFSYGYTDTELTANRMDGSMKTDLDITKLAYTYSLLGAGYDKVRRIDWRYEVGPGLGYHLVKRTNFVLRVEAGFHYQVQNFEDNREDYTFSQRLAQDIRWNIGSQFTFDEKVEYFPDLGDLDQYRLRVEANLRYWLRSNLSLNFTVIDIYDTRHARNVSKNDLQVRSSIGVKF
jgi:Protein of unknown function, DUF481